MAAGSMRLVCSLALLVAVQLQQVFSASHPNIVILFADDLGWGDLGVYGHPTSTSPNLDKMAKEGLVFKQFYSASPVCSPSRAALLTGRYQTRSGIYPGVFGASSTGGLPSTEVTIAEGLKEAGYHTAMVGKWHLGVGMKQEHLPTNHGFDSYFGIPYSHDMCPCLICFYPHQPCFDRCRVDDVGCPIFSNDKIYQQPADFLNLTNNYIAHAIDAIKTATAQSKPFFLYVAFQHTHHPQFSSKQFTNSSIRLTFGDALNELDWGVGQIFQTLKDQNVDDNTFVFFTADNGPSLVREVRGGNAGLLRCGKGTTWEGGQREPAIAWWPGKITPGTTLDLAATVDMFPTVMKIAEASLPSVPLDGFDMSSILFENKPNERDFYMYYPKNPSKDDGLFAVRWKQYKAHFFIEGSHCDNTYPDMVCRGNYSKRAMDPPLLYDLHSDPGEIYALNTTDPTYAEILKKIVSMKDDFNQKMVWGDSQMKGSSKSGEPCAKPGCSPFPTCCTTDKPSHEDHSHGKAMWTGL